MAPFFARPLLVCWMMLLAVVLPAQETTPRPASPETATPGPQPPASARQWLRQFDRDADQKLDENELREALRQFAAAQHREDLQFVRVQRERGKTPVSLDTSLIEFASADDSVRVALIGAVHVADESYYKELNRRFQDFDVVLYELVAPEGTRVPAGGVRSQHPVGHVQQSIKSVLGLSFQLEQIDYNAANLVHADMSPEEFAASMEKRGESFLQIVFRAMGQASTSGKSSEAASDLSILRAMFAKDRPLRLKRLMAPQFENLEGQMKIIEGPDGSTLISERNKIALGKLREEMKKGHDRLAIFYGAGHLPDMASRLREEFQMSPVKTEWLTAWDMRSAADAPAK